MGTRTATCLPASIGLEGGAHGDLGLAVADVAADQAVHRPGLGHVVLDRLDRRELVGRLLVGEGGLELGHPVGVLGGVGDAGLAGALGLDVDQVLGEVDDRLGDALLRASPSEEEPIFESGGSALPPPTYFWTRSILAIGT